jgi:hypothetical protein
MASGDWEELGNGIYEINFSATELNTSGRFKYYISVAGALPYYGLLLVKDRTTDAMDDDIISILADTGTDGVKLANDAITSAKYDETTAFALGAEDAGATSVARTGADADTLETLSDEIALVKLDTAAILLDTGTDGVVVASFGATAKTEINAEVDTALSDIDLDHLIQVSSGAEQPTIGSYLDAILHKDTSQSFDRSTDSLEALRDRGDIAWITATGIPSAATIADAVWDELLTEHTGGTTFGGKNQLGVPSETLNDYKADVSGVSTFDASTTPVEILTSGGTAGTNAEELVDLVWDELISGHTGGTTFGGKNQKVVPSETLADYKADVSGLSTFDPTATPVEIIATGGGAGGKAADEIVDDIWDELITGHDTTALVGAFGHTLNKWEQEGIVTNDITGTVQAKMGLYYRRIVPATWDAAGHALTGVVKYYYTSGTYGSDTPDLETAFTATWSAATASGYLTLYEETK